MQKEKKKLCIATLDPFNGGGVFSMVDFFYPHAKNKYDPSIVYNLLPGFRSGFFDVSLVKFLLGSRPKVVRENVFHMKGIGIQRVFPLFEFLNYVFNLDKWKEVFGEFDIFFALGGANIVAMPFALLGKDFSIWVASTLYEDRIDRIKKEPFLRKIRNLISLPFLLVIEKYVFKKAKKILTISNYTKGSILKKYPFVENKIETVFYPIDTDFFKPAIIGSAGERYILFTGRITDERKNIRLLIKAFSLLPSEFKDIKLKLVGRLPFDDLITLCRGLGIEKRVEFPGFLKKEDFLLAYQGASLFVIPSFQEGLCISGLEAMACGIPVVSTKCGGPEDFVIDGVNGFLCENDNINDISKKILHFFTIGEEERKKMSTNARNYILDNHNQLKIWDKLGGVLDDENE